jgi:hypothetical protein
MSERIDLLREAVEAAHKCKALHDQSVPVREMFGDKVVWEGVVEKFALLGHPKAKWCYAWSFQDGTTKRYVTVLELPPVESPQTAVRAAIASKAQK